LRQPAAQTAGMRPEVARARHLALERAELMRLTISASGHWRVESERAHGALLLEGDAADRPTPASMLITATGLCLHTTAAMWDPIRCVPADEIAASRERPR
jgi:hypothetical protein